MDSLRKEIEAARKDGKKWLADALQDAQNYREFESFLVMPKSEHYVYGDNSSILLLKAKWAAMQEVMEAADKLVDPKLRADIGFIMKQIESLTDTVDLCNDRAPVRSIECDASLLLGLLQRICSVIGRLAVAKGVEL